MNDEARRQYVFYRMASARTTLEAAVLLGENGFWNSAVNRLYYALFYSVNALLVTYKIETKSHTATKGKFSQHFVKTGKFEKKYGKLFSELFDWRQKGDYSNIFEYDDETVKPLFGPVSEMIDAIEKEIKRGLAGEE